VLQESALGLVRLKIFISDREINIKLHVNHITIKSVNGTKADEMVRIRAKSLISLTHVNSLKHDAFYTQTERLRAMTSEWQTKGATSMLLIYSCAE